MTTTREIEFLQRLAECEPGKGLPVRFFGFHGLVRRGMIEHLQGGPVRVAVITEKGREELRRTQEGKRTE